MPRIQINLIGTSARPGASWTVTTQWAISALPTPGAMATALANARTALVADTAFKASIAANYSLVSLRALGYAGTTGPATWTVDASGAAVAGTGIALPPPLAMVVTEQTSTAGPSYRGRSYWPGCGTAGPGNDGNFAVGSQTVTRAGWIAMHSDILTALGTLGGTPIHVVYSPKTGNMTPINTIRTGNRVDTARGRFGDAPEAYISQAVPGTLSLTETPSDPGDVSPQALGLPADAAPADVQALIDAINSGNVWDKVTIGPLKDLAAGLQTLLKLKEG